MKWWRIAAAGAGLLAACIAVPVQGAEWCVHDPQLIIQTWSGDSLTVYVTDGVMGSQHEAALASANISYTTYFASKDGLVVAVHDYIPTDSFGSFATEMVVSSQPYGAGEVYGSMLGRSGSTMTVWFWINRKKLDK